MNIEKQVVSWLAQQEPDIYVVGGTVRDRLLGRPVHDLDLAVSGDGLALARRLANHFQGAYYALDEVRSTGRAVLQDGGGGHLLVDVARFRGSDPQDASPALQSLRADLDDRDFTINALAANVRALDDTIDRHDGLDDLAAGLIRPVSDGCIRDDPLRAIRAVRLAASLKFALAPETEALIRRDGAALDQVSSERVRDELARLLVLPQAAGYLVELNNLGLLTRIFPELEALQGMTQSPPHSLDVLDHSLETVRVLEAVLGTLDYQGSAETRDEGRMTDDRRWTKLECSEGPTSQHTIFSLPLDVLAPYAENLQAHVSQHTGEGRPRWVTLKLAALLHDTGKSAVRAVDEDGRIRFIGHEAASVEITGEALRRLRFNNTEVRLAQTIVRHHMRPLLLAMQAEVSSRAVYRFFRDTGGAGVDVLLHALADNRAKNPMGAEDDAWLRLLTLTARMLADYYEQPAKKVHPPLLLDGNDLMREFELQPGPQIGELLELVREAQVSGEVGTLEQALALVRTYLTGES